MKNVYPEEIESIINEFEFVFESLMFQQNNQIAVRIRLNYEVFVRKFASDNHR